MKFEFADVLPQSPHDVFALISDIERKHEWVSEVISSRQTSDGPVGKGTTYVDVVRFMGKKSDIPTVITQYEQDRLLAYRHLDGPIKAELRYELEPEGEGTRLKIDIDAEFPWLFNLLGFVLRRKMRQQMDGNFAALKAALAA